MRGIRKAKKLLPILSIVFTMRPRDTVFWKHKTVRKNGAAYVLLLSHLLLNY